MRVGRDGAFITGSDFLIDGGVTAAYWFGELALKNAKGFQLYITQINACAV
jgi:hypothetical protein